MEEVQVVDTVANSGNVAAQGGGWGTLFVYCLAVFAIVYFLMVRPNKKRMAEYQKMIDSIKVGDRVMAAGIYGKVKKIEDNKIELEIAKGVVIEVNKNAIGAVEK